MSKREEDFDTQSDKYVEMRKSFGVNDPYALKEIGEAHYQDLEYGYQYALQHPHWIPVEERFPEKNTTPLVRMDLSDKFNEETIIYDVVVFDQNGFHTPYKVTHWMEIQPPRKEE